MSYFVITSNHPRHFYFLEQLENNLEIELIIIVPKKGSIKDEEIYFCYEKSRLKKRKNVVYVDSKDLHSKKILQEIIKIRPEIGIVFGGPILKESIFKIPSYGCINIHTGLVQFYRGVDSTIWPLYENKPNLIGYTIHLINKKIDAGDILFQDNIKIKKDDNLEKIFFRTCKGGIDALIKQLKKIKLQNYKYIKLDEYGKVYKIKDMTPKVLEKAKINLHKFQKSIN